MNQVAKAGLIALFAALLLKQQSDQQNSGGNSQGQGSQTETCSLDPSGPLVEIAAQDLLARIKAKDPGVWCQRWRVVLGDWPDLHGVGDVLATVFMAITMENDQTSPAEKANIRRLIEWFRACEWRMFPSGYMQALATYHDVNLEMRNTDQRAGRPELYPGRYNNELLPIWRKTSDEIRQWEALYKGFPIFQHWQQVTRSYPGLGFGHGQLHDGKLDATRGIRIRTMGDIPEVILPIKPWQTESYIDKIGLTEQSTWWLRSLYHKGSFCQALSKHLKVADEVKDALFQPERGHPSVDPLVLYQVCWSTGGHQANFNLAAYTEDGWARPGTTKNRQSRDVTDWRLFAVHSKLMLYEYAMARFMQMFYLRGLGGASGSKVAASVLETGIATIAGIGAAAAAASNPVGWISAALALIGGAIKTAVELDGLNRLAVGVRETAGKYAVEALARFGLTLGDLPGWRYGYNHPGPDQAVQKGAKTRAQMLPDPWHYFFIKKSPQLPLLYLNLPFDMPDYTTYTLEQTHSIAFRLKPRPNAAPDWEHGHFAKPRL